MKIAALILIALCPMGAFAQATKPSKSPAIKLIKLHYVDPDDIRGLLNGMVGVVAADKALNAVVLRGRPEAVAKAEQMIQKLDVPQPKSPKSNVELTVYVVGATDKPIAQAPGMPENLRSVVRQLEAIFPYSNYSLLDSMLVRSREGSFAANTGMLKEFPQTTKPGGPEYYHINYYLSPPNASAAPESILLSKFSFRTHRSGAILNTTVDLRQGQKVVVGKTNIDGGNAALFVVLSAHIE